MGARGENVTNIIFLQNINFHIPQNSNGASRIIFIISLLLICFYNFYLQDKLRILNILLFISALIFASINIFYQSKLNILAFIIACLYIFLSNRNYKKKIKILSLLLFLVLPFLINTAYNKYHNDNYSSLQNNRLFNDQEGFLLFSKFKIFNTNKNTEKYKNTYDISNLNILCITHDTSIDKFLGGRVCGWELLTKVYFDNFKFFGNGFFEDRKILKPFQKISSNSYIFALYNAGILSFFILIIFYVNILIKIIRCTKISIESKNSFLATTEFYKILALYLIIRSFFEDTLAFVSIDLLLIVSCISFFNYFFDIAKNCSKKSL